MGKIKWIKITTDMFDDEKIKLIDAMPERDTIHYIWVRLLVQAGKTNANGYIFLNENVPYTEEMLSTIFNRPLNTVRLALQTLSNFGMIHVQGDKVIQICNWDKHQNVEGMDRVKEQNRLRKQKQRASEKAKLIPETCTENSENDTSRDSHVTVTQQNKNKNKNKNKKEELDKEIDITTTTSSYSSGDFMKNINSNAKVFKHLEKCNFIMSPNLMEKVSEDIEIYSAAEVIKASEIADENGNHRYSYLKGILERRRANNGAGGNATPSKDRGEELREEGLGL